MESSSENLITITFYNAIAGTPRHPSGHLASASTAKVAWRRGRERSGRGPVFVSSETFALTYERCAATRQEAIAAGDHKLANDCDKAMSGVAAAARRVARVLAGV